MYLLYTIYIDRFNVVVYGKWALHESAISLQTIRAQ